MRPSLTIRSAAVLTLLALMLLAASHAAAPPREERWALLVGVERCGEGVRPFAGARRDVALLRAALRDHCGVPEDHILAMTDDSPTARLVPSAANIDRALRFFQGKVKKTDAFFFFFAGHIVGDDRGCVLFTTKSRPGAKEGTWREAVPVSKLVDSLERITAARKLVLADGWREPPLEGDGGEADNVMASTFASSFHMKAPEGQALDVTLFACDIGGRSCIDKEEQCGLFARALVKGLEGGGADESGRIRLLALGEYVRTAVLKDAQAQWSETQTPYLEVRGGNEAPWVVGHRVGAELEKFGDLIVTSTPSGAVVALDGRPRGETPLTIALVPAGRHRLTVEREFFLPASVEVDVTFETPQRADVALEARRGGLSISSSAPGSTVFLDWRFLGSAPVTLPDAAAGSHAVKVLSADKAWVGEVVVAPGESKRLEVAPDRPILESLPGGKLLNHRDGTTLVRIPKGAFIAGSATGRPEERPLRRVEVDDFFIGLCEITNGQYASFLGATGRARQLREMERTVLPGKVDHPVVNVSWPEAESYCRWAGMRLPTEPEWEKAARGTDGRAYPWGDTWDRDRCNNWQLHSHGGKPVESASFGGIGTTPVGTFPAGASAWGCLDMAGNVWEWTADLFRVPADIETETPASHRVVKGGSWYLSTAEETRCAARYGFDPGNRYLNLGFRTAISRP